MELVVRHADREANVHLEPTATGYRVRVDATTWEVDVALVGDAGRGMAARSLILDGRQYEVTVRDRGPGQYAVRSAAGEATVEVMDPLTHLAMKSLGGSRATGAHQVTAYMPGRVVKLLVQEGEVVKAGQGLIVLEAMKMENEIPAESPGVVQKILVKEGQPVEGGDPLFEIA